MATASTCRLGRPNGGRRARRGRCASSASGATATPAGDGLVKRLSPDERLARFGPGAGDRIRLADTDLWVRVGEDRQAPGDEPIWGYARNLRAGLAQAERSTDSQLDVLIAGVVVIDPTIGVVKADIGIKDGRIVGVGRAGNPADQRRDRPRGWPV